MRLPFLQPRDAFVTCTDRDDGGGAWIAAQISTMIFARLRGVRYAHTPVGPVAHAPVDESTEHWSRRWEEFFSLGDGEIQAADLDRYPRVAIAKPHRARLRSHRLHVVSHCHKVTNHHPEAWAAIAPEIRNKYELSPKPELPPRSPGKVEIAVHLRRGDVAPDGRYAERFSPNERVLPCLRELSRILGPDRCSFHLHSQGKTEDFPEFSDMGFEFHLDRDPFESFHHMSRADVLLAAKSTFSYLAGLIGTGIVVLDPFWHPALPDWLTLDQPDLTARIEEKLSRRGSG